MLSKTRPVDLAEVRVRLDHVLPQIAAGAAARDRERIMPFEEVAAIAGTGVLSIRVPRKFGGAGATVADTARFLIDLAAADANVAQAVRTHFAFIEALLMSDDETLKSTWFARFVAGDLFSATGAEIGGRHGEITAKIQRYGDAFIVNGQKFYSTGCLFAHWIASLARNEDGNMVVFAVPRDREGMELLDDFDAIGQRLTASGTTIITNMRVEADEILAVQPNGPGRTLATSFAQLYLACILAGIARSALREAIWFAREKARPISHSGVARSVDDPYVRETIGSMSANVFAIDSMIAAAAHMLDLAWQDGCAPSTEAAIAIAKAQILAGQMAMQVAQNAFDVGGASTGARQLGLDRHWRNARIVANHNPLRWKSAVVGDHALSANPPPDSDLF